MNRLDAYIENLTPNNCNYRLSELYKKRDACGEKIDRLTLKGRPTMDAEIEYDEYLVAINLLCAFRRNHECALEGDSNYECN